MQAHSLISFSLDVFSMERSIALVITNGTNNSQIFPFVLECRANQQIENNHVSLSIFEWCLNSVSRMIPGLI